MNPELEKLAEETTGRLDRHDAPRLKVVEAAFRQVVEIVRSQLKATLPKNWDDDDFDGCISALMEDDCAPEPEPTIPIGNCPKCGIPVYTVEGFCGVCEWR